MAGNEIIRLEIMLQDLSYSRRPSLSQPYDEHNQRNHNQNVYQASQMKHREPKQPQNDQYDYQSLKHDKPLLLTQLYPQF